MRRSAPRSRESAPSQSRSSKVFIIGVAGLAAGLSAVLVWSGLTVLKPADVPPETAAYTTVAVVQGEVSSSIPITVASQWTASPVGTNQSSGVVTTIDITPGSQVHQGDVLYTVNLRPVVVATGNVPSFQPIGLGTKGVDVQQLQGMLKETGFYAGPADGAVGPATVDGIKKWQKSHNELPTGEIAPGDVLFVPNLPIRVSLDESLARRGGTLSGGELIVNALSDVPIFTIHATELQATQIPTGTQILITSGNSTWKALTAVQTRNVGTGSVDVQLTSTDSTPICVDQCLNIPVGGETLLSASATVVSPVSGAIVPTAAVESNADGTVEIVTASGEHRTVKIVATAKGMSVIDGIDLGELVRIPASRQSN